jgi:hypothetical protein
MRQRVRMARADWPSWAHVNNLADLFVLVGEPDKAIEPGRDAVRISPKNGPRAVVGENVASAPRGLHSIQFFPRCSCLSHAVASSILGEFSLDGATFVEYDPRGPKAGNSPRIPRYCGDAIVGSSHG